MKNDVGEQVLLEQGVPQRVLEEVASPVLNARKLDKGRIDLWAYGDIVAKWVLKENGFNPEDFEAVYTLKNGLMYFAFHIDTADHLILQLQQAFDDIKAAGKLEPLLNQFIN